MFKNEFILSGYCKRKNEMKQKDTEKLQGYYISLATIGESYGVYLPKDCPGADLVKLEGFYEVKGKLKTKNVQSSGNSITVTALSVDSITSIPDPYGKK